MNSEQLHKLIELKRQSAMKSLGIEAGIDSLDEISLNMLINDEIGKLLTKKEFARKLMRLLNKFYVLLMYFYRTNINILQKSSKW